MGLLEYIQHYLPVFGVFLLMAALILYSLGLPETNGYEKQRKAVARTCARIVRYVRQS